MSGPWDNYQSQSAPSGPWEKYGAPPPGPPSAASPLLPPTLKPPQIPMHKVMLTGGTSENPDPQRNVAEQVGQVGEGMGKGVVNASAPVTAHRLLQGRGIAPAGDMYSGEPDLKGNISAAGQMMALGGIEGAEATPAIGRPQMAAPEAASEAPGMTMRVGKVLAHRIPGVKLASDLADAVKGPPPIPRPIPKPTASPIPSTEGMQWGTGGKGPIELRGKMIPPEPTSPPLNYPPDAPVVIARPNPERQRYLEDKGTEEQIREAAEGEDRTRLSQEKREWFARNAPASTKGELGEQFNAQIAKPSSSTPTNAVKARGVSKSPPALAPGTRVPGPDEDLTPLLKKSLRAVKKAKKAD